MGVLENKPVELFGTRYEDEELPELEVQRTGDIPAELLEACTCRCTCTICSTEMKLPLNTPDLGDKMKALMEAHNLDHHKLDARDVQVTVEMEHTILLGESVMGRVFYSYPVPLLTNQLTERGKKKMEIAALISAAVLFYAHSTASMERAHTLSLGSDEQLAAMTEAVNEMEEAHKAAKRAVALRTEVENSI